MNEGFLSDSEIIGLYRKRSKQAIEESDAKYGAYCYAVANNILCSREDSEECVNDTWLCAWNAIPPKCPEILKMFFAKITRNLSLDRLRREGAKKRGGGEFTLSVDELGECIPDSSGVEDDFDAKLLGDCVNRFLRTVPLRDRQIFLRRYFFTEAVSDIAKRCGITENAASVSLHRTREKLREYLRKEGFLG